MMSLLGQKSKILLSSSHFSLLFVDALALHRSIPTKDSRPRRTAVISLIDAARNTEINSLAEGLNAVKPN